MSAILYAGPGKVFVNAVGLQADGTNGQIKLAINETTAPIATAMFSDIGEQLQDQIVELSTKPFDNWGLLGTLFPAYLGVKVGSTAAALAIGTRPHGAAGSPVACKVWTPDGRLYNIVRTAITQQPSLHLGIGKGLFGDIKITGIGANGVAMGSSGFLIAGNAITESAASDPGGAMTMADFVRESWTGAWGTVAGFGGDAGAAIQAEDEWTIESQVKWSPLKVQGMTLGYKLDSVKFMAKCKPYGPSHTNIVAAIGAHTQGQRLGSADLVLTSLLSSKTITLKNAEIKGAGFVFGGTSLGTDEVGFVNLMAFTTGAATSLLEFSA